MNTTQIEWTLDRTYSTVSGAVIRVLQRQIPEDCAEILQELEPFHSLPTLLRASINHREILLKGMIASSEYSSGSLCIGFRSDEESGATARIHVGNIALIQLTIWRVDSKLNALQLNVECGNSRLYFQTGGSALLPIFLKDRSQTSLELWELFRSNGRVASNILTFSDSISFN